jgi:hypothetical protein
MTSLMVVLANIDVNAPVVAGTCIGLIIGIALGTLFGAVILRAAAHWAVKIEVPFWRACRISLLNAGIGFGINFAIGILVGMASGPVEPGQVAHVPWPIYLVTFVLSFFVASLIYGALIKTEDHQRPIGFGKGARVALMTYAIGLGIAIVMLGVAFAAGLGSFLK